MDHGPQINQGTLHCNSGKLVYYNYYNSAFILIGLICITKIYYSNKRGELKEEACLDCNEFHSKDICSGFKPKIEGMNKFEKYLKEVSNGS